MFTPFSFRLTSSSPLTDRCVPSVPGRHWPAMGSEQSTAAGAGAGAGRVGGSGRMRTAETPLSPQNSVCSDGEVPYVSYTHNLPIGEGERLGAGRETGDCGELCVTRHWAVGGGNYYHSSSSGVSIMCEWNNEDVSSNWARPVVRDC